MYHLGQINSFCRKSAAVLIRHVLDEEGSALVKDFVFKMKAS